MDFYLQRSAGEIESVYNFTGNGREKTEKKTSLYSTTLAVCLPLGIWKEGAQGEKQHSYVHMDETNSHMKSRDMDESRGQQCARSQGIMRDLKGQCVGETTHWGNS